MYTISDNANKEIQKAKKALDKAIQTLTETTAYNNTNDIFHASTVYDVNRLITAISKLND